MAGLWRPVLEPPIVVFSRAIRYLCFREHYRVFACADQQFGHGDSAWYMREEGRKRSADRPANSGSRDKSPRSKILPKLWSHLARQCLAPLGLDTNRLEPNREVRR